MLYITIHNSLSCHFCSAQGILERNIYFSLTIQKKIHPSAEKHNNILVVYRIVGESGRSSVVILQAVIVLHTQFDRGSLIKYKMIGILKILDSDEQDDKLMAVHFN